MLHFKRAQGGGVSAVIFIVLGALVQLVSAQRRKALAKREETPATPYRSAPIANAEEAGVAPVASKSVPASLLRMWLIGSAIVMAVVWVYALLSRM